VPLLVQFSIVAAAIAFIVVSIVAIRALQRLDRAADEIALSVRTISNTVNELKPAVEEARQVIARFGTVAPHLEKVAERFERLGNQVANVSESVVNEIESPIRAAAAVARGVRIGTNHLMGRLFQGRASTNARGGSYDG